jgi:hypothetical protein
MSQIFATERIENGYHGWNNAGNYGLVDVLGVDIAFGKKIGCQDVKLIFRGAPFSSYPPVLNQTPAIVNAYYGVGIADIDNKEHD